MRRTLLPASLLALAACSNAGEDLALPPTGAGPLGVAVYFDRDGTGSFTSFDTVFAGARVALFVHRGLDTITTGATGEDGTVTFIGVPFGRYEFAVVPGSLGDSLPVVDGDTVPLRITADPDSAVLGATVRVSHATLSLDEARQAPSGQRVFVRAIVTSALQYFSDSSTFLTTGNAHLRVTRSAHRPGRSGNNPGDSVIVLGTIGTQDGQPVLLNGLILTVSEQPVPTAEEIVVTEITDARGGMLDAALVHLVGVEIADTATVGADFHIRIASGADTALVVLDSLITIPREVFAPGRDSEWRGLLVPAGDGSWFLRARVLNGDIVLN
jgi:hypothetical protein